MAFADIISGLYGVIGIQAALADRARTGLGQHVDISLLDSMTAVLANQAMNYLASGKTPLRLGNAHPNIVPYQVFAVADGHIIVACGNDRQFRSLCQVLGRMDLADDPAYANNAGRVANRTALTKALQDTLNAWTKAKCLDALEDAVVPAGPINTVEEALADPQIVARGLQIAPQGVPGLRSPLKFSRSALVLEKAAPKKP